MPVSGHPIPGPDRSGPGTMDHALEAGVERVAITFADRFPAAETY
jgi:hypothetical protein